MEPGWSCTSTKLSPLHKDAFVSSSVKIGYGVRVLSSIKIQGCCPVTLPDILRGKVGILDSRDKNRGQDMGSRAGYIALK